MGHCETAAGIMGLLQPLVGLVQAQTAKVMHLSSLNPHVSNVVRATAAASTRGGNGVSASIMAPRQASGSVSLFPRQRSSTGVGAFAFQGTNAHALLLIAPHSHASSTGGGRVRHRMAGASAGGMLLERRKHWPAWASTPPLLTST